MTPPDGSVDDADIDQRLGELMDSARANDLLKEGRDTQAEAEAERDPFSAAAEHAQEEATTDEAAGEVLSDAADATPADPFGTTTSTPTQTAEVEASAPAPTAPAPTEPVTAEPTAEAETDTESAADESAADGESGEAETAEPEPSPYDRQGDWYVVHTYAGYENKVKSNLANRIRSMHVEERIFEVVIPMEDVIEFKGGQRRVVQKKVFPGYLLVRMDLDDDSWYVVRNTPGVTGFVGPSGSKPSPLSKKEVEDILGTGEKPEGGPAVEKKVRPRVEFEEGEQVRVVTGPFADFNGAIAEIDVDRSKLKVLVNIFGRETPVELEFGQVAKL